VRVTGYPGAEGCEPRCVTDCKDRIIYLRNNRILALPATSGIFDAMIYLNGLDLSGNRIAELSAPLFDKLTSLVGLILTNNELSTLWPGLLDKLTNLQILMLHGNDLENLPSGLFDRLTNLRILYLRCDPSWGISDHYSRCAASEDNPRLTCVPLTYAQISRPFDSPSTLGTEGLESYHGPMLTCECQAGYTGIVAGVCPCNAGYTGPDGADGSGSTCTACVAGKFKTAMGSADCSDCPGGKYSSTVGATADVCIACPANTWLLSLPVSLPSFLLSSLLLTSAPKEKKRSHASALSHVHANKHTHTHTLTHSHTNTLSLPPSSLCLSLSPPSLPLSLFSGRRRAVLP